MNRLYPHPIIAREGWPIIGGGLALSLLVSMCCGWWSLPFWVFTVFALQFFRDPAREIPQNPEAVLSPVDGRIVVVERARDPYRDVDALKISIFMNVFNVHSQKSPADCTVTKVVYNKGKFVNADLDKASTENERNAVWRLRLLVVKLLLFKWPVWWRAVFCATPKPVRNCLAANAMALSASVRAWICICLSMRRRKWRLAIK